MVGIVLPPRLTLAAHPSMYSYADGRLHLTAVVLLAPHLNPENADELLSATAHKTRTEIERLLAERFPRPDVPTVVHALATAVAMGEPGLQPAQVPFLKVAGAPVVPSIGPNGPLDMEPLALAPVVPSVAPNTPVQMEPLPSHPKLAPLSPGRFALQVTLNQHTYEQLRYAQALLGHALPSGDVAQVLERALVALVEKLEKQKFAKCAQSRPRSSKAKGRHIPAEIRRTVWQRDGGQCTFVSEKGDRCEARTRLEFDHIEAVARGGQTSTAGLRPRCQAHNQHEAECTFGAGFMQEKREDARCKAARAKERKQAAAERPPAGLGSKPVPSPPARLHPDPEDVRPRAAPW